MRKIKNVRFALVFGSIAIAALTFSLFPTLGLAETGCTEDQDCDGIPDTLETTNGITLTGGQRVLPCTGAANEDRHTCLKANAPDLFVILVRANGCPGTPPSCTGGVSLGNCSPLFNNRKTNIPLKPYPQTDSSISYDPWRLVEASAAQGGLGITIHEITASQVPSTRIIPGTGVGGIPVQKAVRLTESLNACGTDALGSSSPGTPNTTGVATLYTERIKNKIDKECDAGPNGADSACYDPDDSAVGRTQLNYLYIQSLLVHELGHVTALTKTWTPDWGGPHEPPASRFIMEQKPDVKIVIGDSVKWYISTDYSAQSRADVKLK